MKPSACEADEILLEEVTVQPGGDMNLRGSNDSPPRHPTSGFTDWREGRVLRPRRLYVQSDSLKDLSVTQVMLGSEMCMVGDGWSVPAERFAEGAPDPNLPMPVVAPGIHVQVTIRNDGHEPVRVSAKLIGPSAQLGDETRARQEEPVS